MPSNNRFLSVMRKASSNGSITLTIRSRNVLPAQSVNVTVAGITTSTEEEDVAQMISDAINSALAAANMAYVGVPYFNTSDPNPIPLTLRAIYNAHYVNIWSQARFDIRVTNDLGCELIESGVPVYARLCTGDTVAPLVGYTAWNSFSSKQKIASLLMGSNELVTMSGGFFLTMAQYLHELRAFATNGFQLNYYPVKSWDQPYVFSPNLLNTLSNTVFPINNEFMVDSDGTVTFPDIGLFSRWGRPLDKDNVLKMTYTAGLDYVPMQLVQECVRVASYIRVPDNIKQLKAGSSSITYRERDELQKSVIGSLRGLF